MSAARIVVVCILLTISAEARELSRDMPDFWDVLQQGAIARRTIQVVDDDGNPVPDADVQISYMVPGGQWIKGKSDGKGRFSAEGLSFGEMRYTIRKEGYYKSSAQMRFELHDGILVKDGKWQPWNPEVQVVLRPIVNPIPMYAKQVEIFIPVRDQPVGYDLIISDWVDPYGKGMVKDFVFTVVHRRVANWSDYDGEISLTFQSSHDGVQLRGECMAGGSSFPWKHHAPDSNYQNHWRMRVGYTPDKGYYEENDSGVSYFRVRSRTNASGEVVSLYGKIPGPFEIDVRETETGWLRFTYYLNPTPNDRNMEFDPSRNLFKKLRSTEQVRDP